MFTELLVAQQRRSRRLVVLPEEVVARLIVPAREVVAESARGGGGGGLWAARVLVSSGGLRLVETGSSGARETARGNASGLPNDTRAPEVSVRRGGG